jgi:hypothetical protein
MCSPRLCQKLRRIALLYDYEAADSWTKGYCACGGTESTHAAAPISGESLQSGWTWRIVGPASAEDPCLTQKHPLLS